MDILTLVGSILSSVGVTLATARLLSKTLVGHWLTKELEKYKNNLQKDLERHKSLLQKELAGEAARSTRLLEEAKTGWQRGLEKDKLDWQGEIQKSVEVYLGEQSAEREYRLEARKRLYNAVGPLKFQLLVASRDLSARIYNFGLDPFEYNTKMDYYYGQSTLYRLLRPVAVAELIERQVTYADFSVDLKSIELLRFKKAALTALTDGDSVLNHPKAKWNEEIEHVFSGTLSRLANLLIVQDEGSVNKRPMHFHEFTSFIAVPKNLAKFSPLSYILDDFDVKMKPIFWIRLVCFGYYCNEYVGREGKEIGFEKREFDLDKMLSASGDGFTRSNLSGYKEFFDSMKNMSL